MKTKTLLREDLYHHVFAILSYQFNEKFAQVFLEPFEKMEFKFSASTGKLRYISLEGNLQASYRSDLGTFTLSLEAASRVHDKMPAPLFSVKVLTEISEFIKQGKSVFSKHVLHIDPQLRIGDEVMIVDEQDRLLNVGKLELPPCYFPSIRNGSAVKVRKNIEKEKINFNE